MLLIYTTSYDTTVDLLLYHMGGDDCFRFNFDLWRDYRLEVTGDGFRIEDPTGRVADQDRVSKVLWRKPFKSKHLGGEIPLSGDDEYHEEELWYAMREIINLLWLEQKIVLVEPRADLRVGKFVQARLARRYFHTPDFTFRCNAPPAGDAADTVVAKSLTSEPLGDTGDARVLYATKVNGGDLSPDCPWMVQPYVEADFDVTVTVVRDRVFAFELDRRPFLGDTIDWRELPVDSTAEEWRPHALPAEIVEAILDFMRDLHLHFGRLDFLVRDGRYHFLEVNPNGQWAWLDAGNQHGMLERIIAEVSPHTPRHPIPVRLPAAECCMA